MGLKILSWNILSGGFKDYGDTEKLPGRINGIASVIKELNPDVVSLVDTYRWTEVFSTDDLKNIFGYPYVYSVKLNDGRLIAKGHDNGITVLSKVPGSVMQTVRIATRNMIKSAIGGFDIFSTYLDDVSEDTRIKQIEEILKLCSSATPTLISGDLNTFDLEDLKDTQKNIDALINKFPGPMKSMENFLNEMKRSEVTKLLKENGFTDFGKGKGSTVPAKLFPLPIGSPVLRLDYAFGNNLTKLNSFKVLTEDKYGDLSDHYPIWMDVSAK